MEIHEDPAEDPTATPFQRIGDDRVHLTASLPVGPSHLDIDAGFGRNRRREFAEAGATDVALGLLSRTYTTDVRLHHAPVGRLAGIIGISGLRNSFEKFGEESLIPENSYNNLGIYAFEQAEVGRWSLSVGARYDQGRFQHPYFSIGGESNARQTNLDPEDFAPEGYTLVNLGAGVVLPMGDHAVALDLQLRNAFDKQYAGFLSRYKTYAFDPGRDFVLQVSALF